MKNISEELNLIVENISTKLREITSDEWNYQSAPGKWTKKEILGHLTDSAVNNHQRFIRVQYEEVPAINYNQDLWVSIQDYKNAPVEILIDLWVNLNKHLAYIISKIPADKYNRYCDINEDQPVTLEWIVNDYLSHLKHHLNQITGENL